MTTAELMAKTPEELNRIAAERVVGWHSRQVDEDAPAVKSRWFWRDANGRRVAVIDKELWSPATDHNDAALLLDRIAELERQNEYAKLLHEITDNRASSVSYWWNMINATPLQLTVAAIAAMGDE